MRPKNVVGVMLLALFFWTVVFAGPFGLEMGMSLVEIGGQPEKVGNGLYMLNTVPKTHSAFKAYVVKVAPEGGLCWVKAIGKDIATSSYGIELQTEFHVMEEKLEAAYGKHEIMDFLMTGSIWDEPNDWMMGLIQKERILAAIWEPAEGSSLPSDLKQIALIASPISTGKGYIAIEYSFINKDSCDAELAALEDDAL